MCEIQCLAFELYTNMVGGGQISHNSYIKWFFVQVLSCITTWKGCTLKILTFIFLHLFMQCPNVQVYVSCTRSFHVNVRYKPIACFGWNLSCKINFLKNVSETSHVNTSF